MNRVPCCVSEHSVTPATVSQVSTSFEMAKLEAEEDDAAVLRRLQECADSHPDDSSHHFNLALFLWEKSGGSQEAKEKAAEHFVASVKLNPHNGVAFKYLGHYYRGVCVDAQRAHKCYQRAITVNPDDSHSGEALCDMLDEGGKESLQISVCLDASERSPRAFWAFRRLGYLQVHQKKWSEAVQNLQHAIRGYPNCADLWEALGLAYQRFGMFTAALKSYGRAIELEDLRFFALVESGNIFLMLGSYRKGVEQFREALKICPQNVCSHYGLASALLGLSKECTNLGSFKWGASLLEEASEIAKASTYLAGNIPCVWKLHGDIQLAYSKCFPWMDGNQNMSIDERAFNDSVLLWRRTCCSAATSARNSYQRALHLAPWKANIYTDIAIVSDLICSLKESFKHDINDWQLPEKMSLGGLLLEGDNSEFWVALGCLSHHNALKQHAFIRGLQLDVSLAVAWAYLGKLYKKESEKQLAQQAFDCARSIDPSLALPWAGMSADAHARGPTCKPYEAYESCLRAVQIFPLAEFQIGLGNLALLSDYLSSSQVFGAIQQAVQRAPHYPESHNLSGLVFESRCNYKSAVASYLSARCAIRFFASTSPKSHFSNISINLARSLCKDGDALNAVRECEDLEREDLLDSQVLQIYALSLWQLGRNDAALAMTRKLAAAVSMMDQTSVSVSVSVSFICRLLYCISGPESAIKSISKMPRELFQSSKVSFIVSSVHALDSSNRLESAVSSSRSYIVSQEDIIRMHILIALGKLLNQGSGRYLGYQSGVDHLRKVLHKYPNSRLLRNMLGYILLCSKMWNDTHDATRCCIVDYNDCVNGEELKSGCEILGAGAVSCYAVSDGNQRFSVPTCGYHCQDGPEAIRNLEKWLHRVPWNHEARYLLILNLMQKAREERFPQHLLVILKRLVCVALASKSYSEIAVCQYKKFQLLLCASEISLQAGDCSDCINHAKTASTLLLPNEHIFFAHLLLCRAYASKNDFVNQHREFMKCLQCKTDQPIGWLCLKFIKYQYKLQDDSNILEFSLDECLKEANNSCNMWVAIFALVDGLVSSRIQDFLLAEKYLLHACSLASGESCLFLCHGAICMELARQQRGREFLSLAVKSLVRSQEASAVALPIVSMLLAQAEGSLGSKNKWLKNLYHEWISWPQEMRPAELFFQMHLLARDSKTQSDMSLSKDFCQNPKRWIIWAIHLNPSCSRYWRALQKMTN